MSNSSDAGGGGRFCDRQHLAKRLEKSNFAQTCSLLSQFLKEKRGFADSSSDQAPRKKPRDELERPKPPPPPPPSTTNCSDTARQQKENLPKFVGFPPSGPSNNATAKGDFRRPATPEPATAQMTIFYAGKVLVYDDFPNERAKEIMAMADKGSRTTTTTTTTAAPAAPGATPSPAPAPAPAPATIIFGSNLEKPSSNSTAGEPNVASKVQAAGPLEQPRKPQPEAKNSSDLPIARRASLHRFLEKRKDRAVVRAPYQVNQQPEGSFKGSGSSSGNEPEPEAEAEEGFPRHLDLNL